MTPDAMSFDAGPGEEDGATGQDKDRRTGGAALYLRKASEVETRIGGADTGEGGRAIG